MQQIDQRGAAEPSITKSSHHKAVQRYCHWCQISQATMKQINILHLQGRWWHVCRAIQGVRSKEIRRVTVLPYIGHVVYLTAVLRKVLRVQYVYQSVPK